MPCERMLYTHFEPEHITSWKEVRCIKDDKELAVELTVAFISANRKISVEGNTAGTSVVNPAIDLATACKALSGFYKTLSALSNPHE